MADCSESRVGFAKPLRLAIDPQSPDNAPDCADEPADGEITAPLFYSYLLGFGSLHFGLAAKSCNDVLAAPFGSALDDALHDLAFDVSDIDSGTARPREHDNQGR
jgi:hypothetical protein